MALALRPETADDRDAIRDVHLQAFGRSTEADLLDALRDDDDLLAHACLVALVDDAVVGHVAFSRATIASGEPALSLGPVGVLPTHQRQGIGGAMIREGLRRAAASPAVCVVLLGDPAYYPRLGFEPARRAGLECRWAVPDEHFLFHRLPGYKPEAQGLVTWAPAFDRFTA